MRCRSLDAVRDLWQPSLMPEHSGVVAGVISRSAVAVMQGPADLQLWTETNQMTTRAWTCPFYWLIPPIPTLVATLHSPISTTTLRPMGDTTCVIRVSCVSRRYFD